MTYNPTDWAFGLAGGLIIGLASALYLLGNGRVAGISGLFGGLIDGALGTDIDVKRERAAFLVGMIGMGAVWTLTAGPPTAIITASTPVLIAAGLLVGYGTRMGAGCTSGHGVCGLSRFSVRSAVGVATFMAAAVATVTIVGG